jgi:hypothetical protein
MPKTKSPYSPGFRQQMVAHAPVRPFFDDFSQRCSVCFCKVNTFCFTFIRSPFLGLLTACAEKLLVSAPQKVNW